MNGEIGLAPEAYRKPATQKRFNHKGRGKSYDENKKQVGNRAEWMRVFTTVEKEAKSLFQSRTVVVHLNAFCLFPDAFASCNIVDTQDLYRGFGGNSTPGLSTLTSCYLDKTIQSGTHNAAVDTASTIALHLLEHPYDHATKLAAHQATLPPTIVQRGNRLIPTRETYACIKQKSGRNLKGEGKTLEEAKTAPTPVKSVSVVRSEEASPVLGATVPGRRGGRKS